VAVEVAGDAHLAATQHTAWMLINLLTRAVGVVSAVHVVCPPDVPLAGRVVPLAARGVALDEALVEGGRAIGAAPVHPATSRPAADAVLVVGAAMSEPTVKAPVVRYVGGYGWWGGISNRPLPTPEDAGELPYGPYAAASLAVGEVYLRARLPRQAVTSNATYGWDCWSQSLAAEPNPSALTALPTLDLTGTALAGVGAVGAMWIHAVWAASGLAGDVLLVDADPKGVTTTNLNRCPIFGIGSLHNPKAPEAARIAADATVTWKPHHGRFEDLSITPALLISAVDTNRARQALQHTYPPTILSASTLDLRAEVLRAGPPGQGACLRCYNPPEAYHGDDDRRAAARAGGPQAVANLAAASGVTNADVQRWLDRGECGEVGDRLLNTLRMQELEPPARFAVGFTSAMAGVMLAAETIKTLLQQPLTTEPTDANNATFQFLHPTAAVNAAYPLRRDPRCPACSPTNPATQIWRDRANRRSRLRQEEGHGGVQR
jgi:hypothetical protein